MGGHRNHLVGRLIFRKAAVGATVIAVLWADMSESIENIDIDVAPKDGFVPPGRQRIVKLNEVVSGYRVLDPDLTAELRRSLDLGAVG